MITFKASGQWGSNKYEPQINLKWVLTTRKSSNKETIFRLKPNSKILICKPLTNLLAHFFKSLLQAGKMDQTRLPITIVLASRSNKDLAWKIVSKLIPPILIKRMKEILIIFIIASLSSKAVKEVNQLSEMLEAQVKAVAEAKIVRVKIRMVSYRKKLKAQT